MKWRYDEPLDDSRGEKSTPRAITGKISKERDGQV